MRLPNFIVAGFPKCGTSSLYNYLSRHPDVFLPERKESHFFTKEILNGSLAGPGDEDQIKFRDQSIDEYKKNYSSYSGEKLVGDVSPSYVSYPSCIPEIKEVLGEVKVIIMVRDPISRAYSNYLHLVSMGRESLGFAEALSSEADRQDERYGDFWLYQYNSLYLEKIQAYKEAFDQVLVVNFELFFEDIQGSLDSVYDFLGVKSIVPDNIDINYNKGGILKRNLLVKVMESDNVVKRLLKKTLKDPKLLKNKLLNKFKQKAPEMNQDVIEKLQILFMDDVIAVRDEFGVDITKWKHFSDL